MHGFTMIELLAVVAVIAILAALLLPALSLAKAQSWKAACVGNSRQINAAVRMYADDSHDISPYLGTGRVMLGFRTQVQSYLGVAAAVSNNLLFACPADRFAHVLTNSGSRFVYLPNQGFHELSRLNFSSYAFNGMNEIATGAAPRLPGIAGRKLATIRQPARTLLTLETAGFVPFSWHSPKRPAPPADFPKGEDFPAFDKARVIATFVDGHADMTKMYWNSHGSNGFYSLAFFYDPPADYAYQWSGD